jgi:HSP20 family protein
MARLMTVRSSQELPRTFGDFQRHIDSMFQNLLSGEAMTPSADFQPPMNVVETEDAFHISVELPGVKPENVNVEVEYGFLKVSGEKSEERTHEGTAWRRVERSYGAFQRVVKLGATVDADRITAESRDGILYIEAPKAAAAKPRKIQVAGASPSAPQTETLEGKTVENAPQGELS